MPMALHVNKQTNKKQTRNPKPNKKAPNKPTTPPKLSISAAVVGSHHWSDCSFHGGLKLQNFEYSVE